MRAEEIKDGSTVTKKTGEVQYTFKNKLSLYQTQTKGEPPILPVIIEGYFLVGARGQINQIKGDLELMMTMTAEELLWFAQELCDEEEDK
jgi:hypothetical protein